MYMVPFARSLTIPAFEPDATANAIVLGEHETTGLLPVGFQFESFGVQYDRFDLSTDGYVRFGNGSCPAGADGCLPLDPEGRSPLGRGKVAYEVRGSAPRRRLVVSFAGPGAPIAGLQLIVYERTGIVELREASGQSLGDPTIRQLDIDQPLLSRANSARKIG
ncbi:MAG TPA: hypothetical protein VH680_16220 [Gemmatimonadales bacterium]|jgi:hypothetical protein